MPENIILFDDFARKLRREVSIRLTWLIGAGMSASAGIPLASEVSRRVILFDHFCDLSDSERGRSKPWNPDDKSDLTYADFEDYLIWYEAQPEAALRDRNMEAMTALRRKPGFEDVSSDDPRCYSLLFARLFLSEDNAHKVLTAMVRRAKGVNLAHLALAGLIRDHQFSQSSMGHTVFTTNFDDLLLKAFLSLDHTARVFGELKSQDRPVIEPTYPQIVHLHGRHTGYRLANTEEQFRVIDPNIRAGFLEQLRGSHLLVLGYSGWDDMAMSVLREWRKDDSLLRGLFWVPFQSEDSLLKETREFLASCPPHKAYIIVNKERTFDADSFMLALCRTVNRTSGFQVYRNGILAYADKQHAFTLSQLTKHPEDDPLRAIELAKTAIHHARDGRRTEAQAALDEMRKLLGADLPGEIRAKALLLAGVAETVLGDDAAAEASLLEALPLWETSDADAKALHERFRTCMALGFVYFRQSKLDQAKELFIDARRLADKSGDAERSSRALLMLASVVLRGFPESADSIIKQVIRKLPRGNSAARAEAHRIGGDVYRRMQKNDQARESYEVALKILEARGDHSGAAQVMRCLADVSIQRAPEQVSSLLLRAEQIFREEGAAAGLAMVNQSRGDFELARNNLVEAKESYEQALRGFQSSGYRLAASSCAADLEVCSFRLAQEGGGTPSAAELINRLRELGESTGNPYVKTLMNRAQRRFAQDGDSLESSPPDGPPTGLVKDVE